jgi:hypothetical protein
MEIMRSIQNLSFSNPMTQNMKVTIGFLCDDSQTTLSKYILSGKSKYGRKIFLKTYPLFLENIFSVMRKQKTCGLSKI